MRALERDFDAAPELAALVADLLEELDAVRARGR
jgi:chaperone modulatory protein CbpM